MGIRGLETFVDRIYHSENRNQVFDELKLSELKLVIDGNQFAYVLSTLYQQGLFGGNYDEFYQRVKGLLLRLKNSIEIIIFDGAKESIEKSKHRLEQKIARVANVKLEDSPALDQKDHIELLKEFPSLFNRSILYKILQELRINYSMCEGMADHVIALYANGHNSKQEKFTVMSKASFFNVYNLEKGYLSTKYAFSIFENIQNLDPDTTLYPVFKLSKIMKFFRLEKQITWIYFCILCGNNDDEELKRNITYLKEFNIDTRGGNLTHLIAHCKLEEEHLLDTNFRQIRVTYQYKRELALKKIDQLIELFEMKNTNYTFLNSFNPKTDLDDFDRIFATVKSLNSYFLNCYVEDCSNEESIFQPAIEFIRLIYSSLMLKSEPKFSQVDEYVRIKEPKEKCLLDFSLITADLINKSTQENKYLNFLLSIKKKMSSLEVKDSLSLFFVTSLAWENWIEKKLIKYKETNLQQKDFFESILLNFIIITLKLKLNGNIDESKIKQNDLTQECLGKEFFKNINESERLKLQEIIMLYDEIAESYYDEPISDQDEYFALDLNIVHRLNEFQAIYYSIGAMNKIYELNFDFLLPHRFLNCFFCVKFIKRHLDYKDVNNNENDLIKLENLIRNCDSTRKLHLILREKINHCKKIINKSRLTELFNNLKLEK